MQTEARGRTDLWAGADTDLFKEVKRDDVTSNERSKTCLGLVQREHLPPNSADNLTAPQAEERIARQLCWCCQISKYVSLFRWNIQRMSECLFLIGNAGMSWLSRNLNPEISSNNVL